MHIKLNLKLCLTIFLVIGLVGCGFHLKNAFTIPPILKVLQLSPHLPLDPLQRPLRQALKCNGVQLVTPPCPEAKSAATLVLLSQGLTERVVAYGADGQANRSVLQVTVTYQIVNASGKVIFCDGIVRVERMLTIQPNSVLGTENERTRVSNELYVDAASQLMRQISAMEFAEF